MAKGEVLFLPALSHPRYIQRYKSVGPIESLQYCKHTSAASAPPQVLSPMASSDDVGLSQSGIKCRRCGGSSLSSWDLFLPITRRGSFFQDSFFSNIHHDFDAAIREVLGRWNEPDLKVTDSRDDVSRRYRRLRSQNMNEESQAVTVTSDNTGHKVSYIPNNY